MFRTHVMILLGLMVLLPPRLALSATPDSTNQWGYGYDSLLKDLGGWRKSPFVKIDSIGSSVQGRAEWMLTITDGSDSLGNPPSTGRKHRVFIHARTHPAEVQANYVANEAIKFLIGDSQRAADLRHGFIFNIIPMYNPDGVQMGHARLNANLVDLESDWDKPTIEPEPAALRKQFQAFMAGPIPIEVALNLHSDQINCTRFFFYHAAAGTSAAYTDLEKDFIEKVRAYFPVGIEDWPFVQSWTDGTQARYPEGFWWLNYKEQVMALTYEDRNCPGAGKFDSTAMALVSGSADYILRKMAHALPRLAHGETRMLLDENGIRIWNDIDNPRDRWTLADAGGRKVAAGRLDRGVAYVPLKGFSTSSPLILILEGPGLSPDRFVLPARRL